ncbi:3-deoxy-manno-octulosonate cytidylyltransferase [bacterium]|nr:3-deoxy-manno-octulosonate cytidylyltransferase [bacterium]
MITSVSSLGGGNIPGPEVVGIIPARWGSTRLPGKPLARLGGRSLIEQVWRRASRARCLSRLLVATDDLRIYEAVREFGGEAVMTPRACASGTDRLARVIARIPCDIVVNIQGDEPFIPPAYIDKLAEPFKQEAGIQMATLAAPLPTGDAKDPNAVKVVCSRDGSALYFSRALIPYPRSVVKIKPPAMALLHLGLYAYQRNTLLRFAGLPRTPLEKTEELEQLRALEHGIKIHVVRVAKPLLSIDTPQDLRQAERMFFRAAAQD